MTDYEAVFEDIMDYTRSSPDGIRNQQDLKRYLRQNDRRNVMTDRLLDKLAETRGAESFVEEQVTLTEVRERARNNRAREKRQKRELRNTGRNVKGTYTQKKSSERFVTFINRTGKEVYFDDNGNIRDKKGRFAKK